MAGQVISNESSSPAVQSSVTSHQFFLGTPHAHWVCLPEGTVNKCLGYAAVAAMLTIGSGRAPAQITTVISSPKRTDSSQQQAVLREKAAQDSTARVTLTGMTQWVDSAAASLSLRPDTASAPPPETATPPRTSAASTDSTARSDARRADEFRNGARAPNTATQ